MRGIGDGPHAPFALIAVFAPSGFCLYCYRLFLCLNVLSEFNHAICELQEPAKKTMLGFFTLHTPRQHPEIKQEVETFQGTTISSRSTQVLKRQERRGRAAGAGAMSPA
jgi:hypothetical protein